MARLRTNFAKRRAHPKPNYALHQLDNAYLVTLWILTNTCLIVAASAGIIFMRRTLNIGTFAQLYLYLTTLLETPEKYKDVAASMMANAPPSISHIALVYFAIYFLFIALLCLYMNLRIFKQGIIRLWRKFKKD